MTALVVEREFLSPCRTALRVSRVACSGYVFEARPGPGALNMQASVAAEEFGAVALQHQIR